MRRTHPAGADQRKSEHLRALPPVRAARTDQRRAWRRALTWTPAVLSPTILEPPESHRALKRRSRPDSGPSRPADSGSLSGVPRPRGRRIPSTILQPRKLPRSRSRDAVGAQSTEHRSTVYSAGLLERRGRARSPQAYRAIQDAVGTHSSTRPETTSRKALDQVHTPW